MPVLVLVGFAVVAAAAEFEVAVVKPTRATGLVVRKEPRLVPAYGLTATPQAKSRLHPPSVKERPRMQGAADVLTSMLGRPVLDRTGIAGDFDFELTWAWDPETQKIAAPQGISAPTGSQDGPSIEQAIRQQVGTSRLPESIQ